MARILLIDDSPSVLELVGRMLSDSGHLVQLAPDGLSGSSLLKAQDFDLLITDIYMPEEDGIQTIRSCRRLHPGVRIIAMSSRGGTWDMLTAARAMGADNTIVKPFTKDQLLPLVDAVLHGGLSAARPPA